MHENIKAEPHKAYMWFQKAYIYVTNTKKKWSDLTQEEKNKKSFEWYPEKMWCIAKNPINDINDIVKACNTDPDINEAKKGVNDKAVNYCKKWKHVSRDYVVYDSHPIEPYDLKLLLNLFGVRIFRFIDN